MDKKYTCGAECGCEGAKYTPSTLAALAIILGAMLGCAALMYIAHYLMK